MITGKNIIFVIIENMNYIYKTAIISIFLLASNLCIAAPDWWLDLSLRKELIASINDFSGNSVGDYFEPNDLISSQIIEGLGGPPKPEIILPDGNRLLSASRPHSGDEKALVVINEKLNVVAAAIISYRCHYKEENHVKKNMSKLTVPRTVSCYSEPKLTIFEREKPTSLIFTRSFC